MHNFESTFYENINEKLLYLAKYNAVSKLTYYKNKCKKERETNKILLFFTLHICFKT